LSSIVPGVMLGSVGHVAAMGAATIISMSRLELYTAKRSKTCSLVVGEDEKGQTLELYRKNKKSDAAEDCAKVNTYGYMLRGNQDARNHVACIAAMEMRRRGYEVIASTSIAADRTADKVASKFMDKRAGNNDEMTAHEKQYGANRYGGRGSELRLTKEFKGTRFRSIKPGVNTIRTTLSNEPNGSRGALFFNDRRPIKTMPGSTESVGRALYYTVNNGVVTFYNPHSGVTYGHRRIASGSNGAKSKGHYENDYSLNELFTHATEAKFLRLDNATGIDVSKLGLDIV